jgi:hypothetical protein
MGYDFKRELESLGANAHQPLIKVAFEARRVCEVAGAVRMDKLMTFAGAGGVSDNWGQLAVVDRLVELGILRELPAADLVTQHRLFAWSGA